MNRIEALADSIAEYSGYSDPTHKLYKYRNPGGLKGYLARQIKDQNTGERVFLSVIDGYRALLYDLDLKCKGESSCGLKQDSPLQELLYVYGFPDETTRYVIKFLRKALGNEGIRADLPLSFFLEE